MKKILKAEEIDPEISKMENSQESQKWPATTDVMMQL